VNIKNYIKQGAKAAVIFAFIMAPSTLSAQAPTVNGLFYGDGDYQRYIFWAEAQEARGDLYYYIDGDILYLAVVASENLTCDNVFGEDPTDQAYVQSAGWDDKHTGKDLVGSDKLIMTLRSGASEWNWIQDYAYSEDGDKDAFEADWRSDHLDGDGSGTVPPGFIESSSSFVANINYHASPTSEWDVTLGGTRSQTDPEEWKSPDDSFVSDNDVTNNGYATWDPVNKWEWPTVYEMSIDISSYSEAPIVVWPFDSHASPAKMGEHNTYFDPDTLLDYGDLPDIYLTLEASGGPKHYIVPGATYLGSKIDTEDNGQPTADASGDDSDGNDDEDGITFLDPFVSGQSAQIQINAYDAGYINAWIDFNNDGDFGDAGENIATDYSVNAGNNILTILSVPAGISDVVYARFRITSGSGMATSPTGLAIDGEVEDYALATVGDYVWYDTDADGIQDGGEAPLAGVPVSLRTSGGTLVGSTTTDASGLYKFTGVQPDDYYIEFIPPVGYAITSPNQGGNDALDSDPDQSTYKTTTFTLVAGENNLDMDAGMYQTATIGDYVWIDTDEDGIQDGGEVGYNGATVNLYLSDDTFIRTTTTNAIGFYEFDNIVPGDYYVEFVLPLGYNFSPQDATSDALDSDANTSTGKTATTTLSPAEDDPTWDAGIYESAPTLASIGDYVWEDTDEDGIQDIGESGLATVTVNLYTSGGTPSGTTTTNGSGNYSFTNLTPGDYYVEFVLLNNYLFSPQDATTDDLDSDANTSTGITATTTLSAGENDPTWDAGMYEDIIPANIGNLVWFDENNNGIQDGGEDGLINVTVNLRYSGGSLAGSTSTDANGYYSFMNIDPGNYYVEFILLSGFSFSPQDAGGDAVDSDANTSTGQTIITTLVEDETDFTWDAGMYAPVQPASIGDYVWVDTDQDGVQDGGEVGKSNVTVNLYKQLYTSGSYDQRIQSSSDDAYQENGSMYLTDNDVWLGYSGNAAGLRFTNVNIPAGSQINNAFMYWDSDVGKGDDITSVDIHAHNVTSPGTFTSANNDITSRLRTTNFVKYDINWTSSENGIQTPDLAEVVQEVIDDNSGVADIAFLIMNNISSDGEAKIISYDDKPLEAARLVVNYTIPNGYSFESTTTTNGSGNYLFANIIPADYQVEFELPSGYIFSAQDQGGNDLIDSDAFTTTGKTVRTSLIAGENDMTWDAGIFVPPPGSIGDYVWHDADGEADQDGGELGIPNVTVNLKEAGPDGIIDTGDDVTYPAQITDANGGYDFTNLPIGKYKVDVDESTLPAGYYLTTNNEPHLVSLGVSEDYNDADFGYKDMILLKEVDKDFADPGDILTYTITPGYDGCKLLSNVVLSDVVPASTKYYGNDNPPAASEPAIGGTGTVSWNLGSNIAGTVGEDSGTVVYSITQSIDDAEEMGPDGLHMGPGAMYFTSSDIELVEDIQPPTSGTQTVGLRFNGINVPQGATITNAYLTFRAVSADSPNNNTGPTNLVIQAQASDDAPAFPNTYYYLTNTDRTVASTNWAPGAWTTGADYSTPNLIDVVQEITDRTLWSSGNSMAFIVTGNGSRSSDSYDYSGIPPKLTIEYTHINNEIQQCKLLVVSDEEIQLKMDAIVSGNGSTVTVTPPTNLTVTLSGGATGSAKISGPTPSSINVPAGGGTATFTYVYTVSATTPGLVTFKGTPTAPGHTFGESISAGIIVTPKLSFQVQIDDPSTENPIVNDAKIMDSNVFPSGVWSNEVETYLSTAIGDYVWNDADQDGIQDGGESGIENVTVNLYQGDDTPAGSTTTTASGAYSFVSLTPGDYYVEFILPTDYSFSPQDQGADDALDSDANITTGKTITTNLTAGETDVTWDAGMYYDPPPPELASIGDYVWDDTDKDGIQDGGELGIENVTVNLYLSDDTPSGTTTTNASGAYSFTDLTPGDYYVEFVLLSGYAFSPKDVGSDDTVDSDADIATGKTIVTTLIANENDMKWDAGMYQQLASIGNYVWLDADKDGIQDVGENGLENVTVNLYLSDDTPSGTTTTNASGAYSFTDLAPDDYYVEFVLLGGYTFSPKDVGGDDALDSDADLATGKTIVTTLIANENDITWDAGVYLNVASIGDVVWDDANEDGIQDGGEPGIENVTVNLYLSDDTPSGTTTTNVSGAYIFTNLTPGDYYVEFILPSGYVFSPKDAGSDDALDSDADLTTGKTIVTTLIAEENDMTWDAGMYSTVASIGNFVWEDTNGNGIQDGGELGIEGVTVQLFRQGGVWMGNRTTDVNGFYLFTDLAPNNYYLDFILKSGYVFTLRDQGADDAVDSDANDVSGLTAQTTLVAGENDMTWDTGMVPDGLGSLGDYVWHDANSNGLQDDGGAAAGIANVRLELFDGSSTKIDETITDANGWYQFTGLAADNYTIILDFASLMMEDFTLANQTYDYDGLGSPHAAQVTLGSGGINLQLDFGYDDQPLPVTLAYFGVKVATGGVKVSWVTESEIENQGFVIERRDTDNNSKWQEIANFQTNTELQGQGTVTYRTEYEYVDRLVYPGYAYEYRLGDVDYDGVVVYHDVEKITISAFEQFGVPNEFSVKPAYPNPFNPSTVIEYGLPATGRVRIMIYDILGHTVKALVDEAQTAGWHSITWQGLDDSGAIVPAGMYFGAILTEKGNKTIKLMYMK